MYTEYCSSSFEIPAVLLVSGLYSALSNRPIYNCREKSLDLTGILENTLRASKGRRLNRWSTKNTILSIWLVGTGKLLSYLAASPFPLLFAAVFLSAFLSAFLSFPFAAAAAPPAPTPPSPAASSPKSGNSGLIISSRTAETGAKSSSKSCMILTMALSLSRKSSFMSFSVIKGVFTRLCLVVAIRSTREFKDSWNSGSMGIFFKVYSICLSFLTCINPM
mmetsp:Transcript_26608/g.30559  ORF Transcript_26608/g.30559 Transcript_26608/m.30559 type:complete len:220 (-) Transcript_26608:93-752(-)